ncbi:hypothetical protein EC396_14315 [Lutibacter sp. HS1-25]|uniref:RHS repeat domain-containing protein n=2 Tax=Lutibacter sp. HS1-25 TaxID=2485000 RepID=UPI001012DAF6|nr:RHS repeat domain-containing protein [Lutibacter sp. HS1-25]RXP46337.1 hypothetical protein EC396_14315 [Lutibacter sp. HS1-25]
MRNTFIIICLLLFNSNLFSQEFKLPEIFPSSPTAAELGKFGAYPVNLSTGLPQIEIPLYTIQSGDLSIPITLKYHASGIKVNQMSSWVGLGWSLDTGGLISLEVRDTPDELEPNPYDIPSTNTIDNIISQDPYNFDHPIIKNALQNSWVKDAYHINLPTVSGTFFLDADTSGEVLTKFPPEAYKVYRETGGLNNTYIYKVIDKYGVSYLFDDVEESRMVKNSSNQNEDYHLYNKNYNSAWLLSKIVSAKGSMITYTYGTRYITENKGVSHSLTYSNIRHRTSSTDVTEYTVVDPYKTSISKSENIANKIQKIDFPNGRIRFITNCNAQYDGVDGGDGIFLDKIIIEKGNDTDGYSSIKTIRFTYSITGSPNYYSSTNSYKYRFKLDHITEDFGPESIKKIADFEYSPVQLPEFNSYSVDFFGMYNGSTNSNLIPRHKVFVPYFTGAGSYTNEIQIGGANRSINLINMQAGMLTKIKYPTKGYTIFDYEPNSFYGENKFAKELEDRKVIIGEFSLNGTGNARYPAPLPSPYDDDLGYPSESIRYTLSKAKKLFIKGNINCSNCSSINSKYSFTEIRITNNGVEKYSSKKTSTSSWAIDEEIFLDPGSVYIYFSVYGDRVSSYFDAWYNKDDSDYLDENVQGFGLRIKKMTNYDSENQFVNQKEYGYLIPGTNNSSGKLVNDKYEYELAKPSFHSFTLSTGCAFYQNTNYTSTLSKTINSSSRIGFENNSITYEYVTEFDKDSLGNTNGRTQYKYTVFPNKNYDPDGGSMWKNNGYMRSKLLEKIIYDEADKVLVVENNVFSKNLLKNNSREEFKLYSFGYSDTDMTQAFCEDYSIPSLANSLRYYDPSPNAYWYKKDKTEVTEYFYDEIGNLIEELKTTSNYIYNSQNQEISESTITNSKNEIIKNSYKYAHDLNDLRLINDNRIAIPLETTKINGSQIINNQKNVYTDYGNLYLPNEIYIKKGGLVNLDSAIDRNFVYDNYDTKGNIIQYHSENTAPVAIIWGYKQQYPVAKIENASYADAIALISQTILDNPTNDSALKTELNKIRTGLPTAMVTTYTYDPLIGITSVTDPKGYTIYYKYDAFNRLEYVKDAEGNILSKNEYNYKGQL